MYIKKNQLFVTYYCNQHSAEVGSNLNRFGFEFETEPVFSNFYGTQFTITLPKKRSKADKLRYNVLVRDILKEPNLAVFIPNEGNYREIRQLVQS